MIRYALCNELFGPLDPFEAGRITKSAGYGGIEFAPYTFFGSFSRGDIRAGTGEMKKVLGENGLQFAGFHWLLVSPRPLSLVSPDKKLRQAALDHLRRLLAAAGELGGGNLILGSPKQRSACPGQSIEEAKTILKENLAALGDCAVSHNSRILLEALDHGQCDVVNTLDEAGEMVRAVNSPGVSGMFDFHNTGDETESWDALIRRNRETLRHVHINEMDGGPPGSGSSDYVPAFKALRETGFSGWISMEIFSRPADPAGTVTAAIRFMRALEG
ncbi:MAG: sugar phosphate isomerase/epimerase [Treponema sp.]|jgi:sugar phosphate isomerase/epimerase|nr:sugar phosphate isomerase/epimerase [Treponema sp.]